MAEHASQQPVILRALCEVRDEPAHRHGEIELRIVTRAGGCLFQKRHDPGISGEQLVQFVPLAQRQHVGRQSRLGVHCGQLLLNRIQIVGGPEKERIRVLLGWNGLTGKVGKLYRIACLPKFPEPVLKPCSRAPDEEGVEHQENGDRASRGDRDPFADLLDAFHGNAPEFRP